MSGEFLTMTLAAGQTMPYQKAGRYVEVITDGGGTIDFTFYGQNGAIASNWKGCQAGVYLKDPWSALDVKNSSSFTQTIKLMLMDNGEGGSRRQPGNVVIIDNVSANCQHVSGGPLTGLTGITAQQILAPASNVNGCLVRSVIQSVKAGAGGTVSAQVVAAPAAPGSFQGANMIVLGYLTDADAVSRSFTDTEMRRMIPAGWGLYLVYTVTTAVAGNNSYGVSFELQ